MTLAAKVALWPTPAASQAPCRVRRLAPSEAEGRHGTMLVAAVGAADPNTLGGHLNPRWVEWLMGFPDGWTDSGP